MPTIHENQQPPERPGNLHTVTVHGMERNRVDTWLSDRNIDEAWIYDTEAGRVMSWYEAPSLWDRLTKRIEGPK